MKTQTFVILTLMAVAASNFSLMAVNAQSLRLTRPSDHMQQGGVDYQENQQSEKPQPQALSSQYQAGAMDNASLRAGVVNRGLNGGVLDNTNVTVPLSASNNFSKPLEKLQNFLRGSTRQLTSSELPKLSGHDIVLLIDKSSSMGEVDCPSMENRMFLTSRWNWCREQTIDLAQQTVSVLPQGISVLLFSWNTKIFPHVDLREIPRIFAENHPEGMTNEGNAVAAVLDDYFQRRAAAHDRVAPLLVAIITDGRPTSEAAVRNPIIEATHKLRSPDEVKFIFLLIGRDQKGLEFIQEMDRGLVFQGARFDIVTSKTFPDLVRTGLASALVDSLSESSRPSLLDVLGSGKHHKH